MKLKFKNIDVIIFAVLVGFILWFFSETFVFWYSDIARWFGTPNPAREVVIIGKTFFIACVYIAGFYHDKIKSFLKKWAERHMSKWGQ